MNKKGLGLGGVVTEYRRKRGITQEKLAEHMGVSKASVSKWETGATYPDITLLPRLAAFFGLSVDELLGYEPQLTRQEIRKLYHELCLRFTCEPFPTVLEACREAAKTYFSCFPLLLQIASLLLNHFMLANTPEQGLAAIQEALALLQRIRRESREPELLTQAADLEALCLLQLGRAEEVFSLLGTASMLRMPSEPLLSQAYQAIGEPRQARKLLQAGIYQSVLELISLLNAYLEYRENSDTFRETCRRDLAVSEAFQLETLHPAILLALYLTAAQGFLSLGDKEAALELLERYGALASSEIYPIRLHGDSYFDLLDEWLEETLLLGSAPPRNDQFIQKDIAEALTKIPAFTPLHSEPKFQALCSRLHKEMTL